MDSLSRFSALLGSSIGLLGLLLVITSGRPTLLVAQTHDAYGVLAHVRNRAVAMGADPDAMAAVVLCEDSALLPDPIGSYGERGPFQILPSTWWAQAPEPWRTSGPDDLDANISAGIAMHQQGLGYEWSCG